MTDSPTVLAATNIMEVASLVSSDSSGGFVSRGLVGWLWSDTEGRKGCFQILLSPPGDAGDTTFFSPLPVLFSSISCMWILLGVILMGTGWTMAVSCRTERPKNKQNFKKKGEKILQSRRFWTEITAASHHDTVRVKDTGVYTEYFIDKLLQFRNLIFWILQNLPFREISCIFAA